MGKIDVVVTSEALQKISTSVIELVIRKNHDYGGAWSRYGIFTPLIRINDKILRVKTLSSGEQALVADEKIEDTLKDIIGYALLALLYLEKNPIMDEVEKSLTQLPLFPEQKLELISNMVDEDDVDDEDAYEEDTELL
jgi:hypothetical protein